MSNSIISNKPIVKLQVSSAPTVSIVMPVYNVQDYVGCAIDSVLSQNFTDFELILVDDGSTDASYSICQASADMDSRVRMLWQRNKGLAGARNTGIRASRGKYIAFLDSDDLWHPDKLAEHVMLLNEQLDVGVSYSSSAFIDGQGLHIGLYQVPKCRELSAKDVLLRNPVGNGSAPVIRREVFEEIALLHEDGSLHYFNESLRQSEDIECWVRIATTTHWKFAGIEKALTYYRVNEQGLSSNVEKQFQSWEQACELMQSYAPDFMKSNKSLAKAFQYRYLARRAIRSDDVSVALRFAAKSLIINPKIIVFEPIRTLITLGAAVCLLLPKPVYSYLESVSIQVLSSFQKRSVIVT